MTQKVPNTNLPDWWQREKQRRLLRVLLFLIFVFTLIGYFYYISAYGIAGMVNGINFDTGNYVAFVRDDGNGHTDLYAVRMDGTGLRRLTDSSDNSTKSQPAWALDGRSLIYAANLADNRVTQIYLLGDGKPTQLTYGTGNKSCPVISPDGQHAAFISQGSIKSVLLNGREVLQLMPQPRNSNESSDSAPVTTDLTGPFLNAAFSGDGKGIAGAQDLTDEASAALVDRAGVDMAVTAIPPSGGSSVTLCSGHEVSMAWEKNGSRLACAFTELHAPNAPSKPGEDEEPSFRDWQNLTGSDKKTTLVNAIQIFSFDPKVKPINVFTGLGYSIEPKNIAWSPDGSRMAFEGWRISGEGQRELSGIAVERLDNGNGGSGVRVDPAHLNVLRYLLQPTEDGKPQNPKWSPDSLHLLFERVKPNGRRDLWTINADGTNAINLTKGSSGDNFDGAWSPAK